MLKKNVIMQQTKSENYLKKINNLFNNENRARDIRLLVEKIFLF